MEDKIKVILVDDHPLMRMGIKVSLISRSFDIDIIGEAGSAWQMFEILKDRYPDIVLLDIIMPEMNGVEAAAKLKAECPDIKILMISSDSDEETILKLVEIGIDGFVSKTAPVADLLLAVHNVADGLTYFGTDIAMIIKKLNQLKRYDADSDFTDREKEVIKLSCEGMLSKEIANHLDLSPRTVESHKLRIFKKLGLNNTVELVKYAIKSGLVRI